MLKLSVVIPAHNGEGQTEETVRAFHDELEKEHIHHEILVVNDNSRDSTEEILKKLSAENHQIRYVNNSPPNGFGFAGRKIWRNIFENLKKDMTAFSDRVSYIVTAIGAYYFFGERLSAVNLVGIFFIMLGVSLVSVK